MRAQSAVSVALDHLGHTGAGGNEGLLAATRVVDVVHLEDTEEAKKARAIAKAEAELLGSLDDNQGA